MDCDFLISEYFKLGFKYSDIIKCMDELYGYVLSICLFKRIIKKIGFYCWKYKIDIL